MSKGNNSIDRTILFFSASTRKEGSLKHNIRPFNVMLHSGVANIFPGGGSERTHLLQGGDNEWLILNRNNPCFCFRNHSRLRFTCAGVDRGLNDCAGSAHWDSYPCRPRDSLNRIALAGSAPPRAGRRLTQGENLLAQTRNSTLVHIRE